MWIKSGFLCRGWKEQDGLGKGSDGITEPIKAEERPERQGLGAIASNSKFSFGLSSSQRKERLKKTQERFDSLS